MAEHPSGSEHKWLAAEPTPPAPPERRSFTGYGLLLVGFVAAASALHWSWYPVFVDTYYHMGVIQGMEQAGGLPTWAFWELAPGGRVHIYPPSLHVVGYFATFLGVSPEGFITFMSWLLYPALFLTMWIWMRGLFGPRPALITVILLSGPAALIWNQTSFNANAFAMTLAPLALLALEKERFLACGVLNLLAATAHPMGLFLPPALALNAILRRKRLIAGLLAASIPVLLYGPWLAHIWAHRAFLPDERTGGDVTLGGIGAGSMLDLGIAMGAAALIGFACIVARRREALGLLGPLLGFAVVLPMGFGGRFFQFNSQWPLAAIGGFGVAMLLERLDRGAAWRRSTVRVASVGVAFLVLATWASVQIPLPRSFGGMPGRRDRAARDNPAARDDRAPPTDPALRAADADRPDRAGPGAGPGGGPGAAPFGPEPFPWVFTVRESALAQLLDPEGQPAPFGGGGPGPGAMRPANRQGADRRAGGARGFGAGPFGGAPPRGGGERGGPGGMDMIHQEGAREFFDTVERLVAPGEVIYLQNPMAASLVTGVTGRWTSSGILRDVSSSEDRATPEECAFLATVGGGFPGGGPGGLPGGGRGAGRGGFPGGGARDGPGGFAFPGGFPGAGRDASSMGAEGFEQVFENSFGSLWKNNAPPPHLEPSGATVSGAGLILLGGIGVVISLLDLLLARDRRRTRLILAAASVVAAGVVLAPLAQSAAKSLIDPPKAPARGTDMPFGGPPPGMAPGGPMPAGMGPGGPGPGAFGPSDPMRPADIPEDLRERYDRIHEAIFRFRSLGMGRDPRSFWAPEDEGRFRELLSSGKAGEAEAFLDDAIRRMEESVER